MRWVRRDCGEVAREPSKRASAPKPERESQGPLSLNLQRAHSDHRAQLPQGELAFFFFLFGRAVPEL